MHELRVLEGGGQDLNEEDGSPILVTILRQPVLERETVTKTQPDGTESVTLKRNGYKRTKEPLDKRTERLLHIGSTRVSVTWGHGRVGTATSVEEFGLKTARMVGNADWILEPTVLKRLRKMAREMFPSEPAEEEATT